MFQFRKEEAAVQAARALAAREVGPILVMVRAAGDVFSIGLRTNAALRTAGRHVATVYCSGHVDYETCDMPEHHEDFFMKSVIADWRRSKHPIRLL